MQRMKVEILCTNNHGIELSDEIFQDFLSLKKYRKFFNKSFKILQRNLLIDSSKKDFYFSTSIY
jgi:hypothetical protein